jgi:hypothetical protein
MVMFHGSSYYHTEGGNTGPTGATGATGEDGLVGFNVGVTGPTGPSVVGITIDSNQKLETTFQNEDGSTSSFVTTESLIGPPNSEVKIFILGENVSGVAGATVYKENPEDNKLIIRALGSSGGVALHTNDNNIEIIFDRGLFGYINVTGGGETGNIIGVGSSDTIIGIPRTKYMPSGENTKTPLTLVNENFTEYFSYKERSVKNNEEGYYVALQNSHIDGLTAIQAELFPSLLDGTPHNVFFDTHTLIKSNEWGIDGVDESVVCYFDIPLPPPTNTSTFMLITRGVSGSVEPGFSDTVKFPFDKEPCFSGKLDITTFFSGWNDNQAKKIWYGIPVYRNGVFVEDDLFSCKPVRRAASHRGNTGACCVGSDLCEHIEESLCDGYFYGAGTTCGYTGNSGNTGNICHGKGACCIKKIGTQTKYNCFDDISSNECMNFNILDDYSAVYSGDGISCKNTDCSFIENDNGYCCDGMGNCTNATRESCENDGYFFGVVGTPCEKGKYNKNSWFDEKTTPCSSGTGGCCIDNVCYDEYSYINCIKDGGLFAGAGSSCSYINCPSGNKDQIGRECSFLVDGIPLYPGDLYAGGMVVGVYKPGESMCFGAPSFGGKYDNYKPLMFGGGESGITGAFYQSKYDYHGYGFDVDAKLLGNNNYVSSDSYIMVVSMDPLAITGDRDLIEYSNGINATSEFYWGNNGSSWGPLYNTYGEYNDISENYPDQFLKYKEGFWYNIDFGYPTLSNVVPNTFTTKKQARINGNYPFEKLLTRPLQAANGLWHRNWGLYNSIRMISADNILYEGYDPPHGNYSAEDYGPGLSSEYISAIRTTRLLDDGLTSASQGITGNPDNVSDWYIPSYDELSFIAANCLLDYVNPYEFNLNLEIMKEGGTPLDGYYWSSTGSFDETVVDVITGNPLNNPHEGLYSRNYGVSAGSVAWAMQFDSNGIPSNFTSSKRKRTEDLCKIRPVRLIRCDSLYHGTTGQNGDILWHEPPMLRDKDKGINQ